MSSESRHHRHISKQELLDAVVELRKSVDQAAAQSAAEFALLHTDLAIVREKVTKLEDAKTAVSESSESQSPPLISVFDSALAKLDAALARLDDSVSTLSTTKLELSNVRLQPENVEIKCCAQQ